MGVLIGENSASPPLTTDQKDAFIKEAVNLWSSGTPGHPYSASTLAITGATAILRRRTLLSSVTPTHGIASYVRSVNSLHLDGLINGYPLERVSVAEILRLQNTVGTQDAPSLYAVESVGDVASQPTGTPDRHWVYCFPVPSLASYPDPTGYVLGLNATLYPPELAAGTAGDTMTYRLPDDEAYMVARLAAALAADSVGRPAGLVNDLWEPFPASMRDIARNQVAA